MKPEELARRMIEDTRAAQGREPQAMDELYLHNIDRVCVPDGLLPADAERLRRRLAMPPLPLPPLSRLPRHFGTPLVTVRCAADRTLLACVWATSFGPLAVVDAYSDTWSPEERRRKPERGLRGITERLLGDPPNYYSEHTFPLKCRRCRSQRPITVLEVRAAATAAAATRPAHLET